MRKISSVLRLGELGSRVEGAVQAVGVRSSRNALLAHSTRTTHSMRITNDLGVTKAALMQIVREMQMTFRMGRGSQAESQTERVAITVVNRVNEKPTRRQTHGAVKEQEPTRKRKKKRKRKRKKNRYFLNCLWI